MLISAKVGKNNMSIFSDFDLDFDLAPPRLGRL